MRLVLLASALLILAAAPEAQEGTVAYDITTRLDIQLPPEMQHMADRFPSSRSETRLLHFDETASLMVAAPRDEDEEENFESSGGMRVMFRGSNENALYTDRDAGTTVEKRDFLGRTFLIDGEVEPLAWKLTDEQSEFLGYPCMKATATRDTVEVEAWFTPEIPVSAGPEGYGGLPGLILVLTVDDARRTMIATDVSLGPLAEGTMVAPDSGRRVAEEEFRAIVEERMEEMGRSARGRNRVIIRN